MNVMALSKNFKRKFEVFVNPLDQNVLMFDMNQKYWWCFINMLAVSNAIGMLITEEQFA